MLSLNTYLDRYSFIQQTNAIHATYLQIGKTLNRLFSFSPPLLPVIAQQSEFEKTKTKPKPKSKKKHGRNGYISVKPFWAIAIALLHAYIGGDLPFSILLLLLIFLRMLTIQPPHVCRLRLWTFFCFSIHFLHAFDLLPVKKFVICKVYGATFFIPPFASSFFFDFLLPYPSHWLERKKEKKNSVRCFSIGMDAATKWDTNSNNSKTLVSKIKLILIAKTRYNNWTN